VRGFDEAAGTTSFLLLALGDELMDRPARTVRGPLRLFVRDSAKMQDARVVPHPVRFGTSRFCGVQRPAICSPVGHQPCRDLTAEPCSLNPRFFLPLRQEDHDHGAMANKLIDAVTTLVGYD